MRYILVQIGLVLPLLLYAHDTTNAEPSLRLEAGVTTHHGEDMASEPGFTFGGSFALTRWAPSEHLALVPHLELLFARRNTSLTLAGVDQAPLSMDSLEIPLVLRGELSLAGRTFYALGGGYGGLLLRAQSMKYDGIVDQADTATSTDIGLLVGAGLELASFSWGELFVETRYQRSYRRVLADGGSSLELFSVLLGYGLGSDSSLSSSSWTKARSLAMKGGFAATRFAAETGSEYGPGVSFGVAFSAARLGSRVTLVPQLEALLVHRSTIDQGSGADSLGLDSLNSSALVRGELSFGERSIFGVGGAYASMLLRAQRTRDGVTTDVRGTLRSFDVGWTAGAGIEITAYAQTWLALEIRYQRSLRKVAPADAGSGAQDTLFCLFGVRYGGTPRPGSGPASPSHDADEVDTAGAGYSRNDRTEGSANKKSGIRVAETTILIGRPGDQWLHTLQFTRVERATHNNVYGYLARYDIAGHGTVELFWPRSAIDFSDRPTGSLLNSMKLSKGRLRYPRRITRRSLPAVHRAILIIEDAYAKQADGAITAMEGFAMIAGLGGSRPSLRATSTGKPPSVNVRQPGRAATRRATKGKVGRSKSGKSKSKTGKAAGQIKGRWVPETLSASKRAIDYQARFGRRGHAYRVNGVDFDGVANGILLEAKGPGYAGFLQKNGTFYDWFLRKGGKGFISQARRQIRAAGGIPVHWHVAEEAVAKAIRTLFRENKLTGVHVFFTP